METIEREVDFWEPSRTIILEFYRHAILPELVVPQFPTGQAICEPFLTAPDLVRKVKFLFESSLIVDLSKSEPKSKVSFSSYVVQRRMEKASCWHCSIYISSIFVCAKCRKPYPVILVCYVTLLLCVICKSKQFFILDFKAV